MQTTSWPRGTEIYSIELIKQVRKEMENCHPISWAVRIEVSSVDRII
jgi:hypothetical protein